MPLLEAEATIDSACISTAPVFKDKAPPAKALSESWWAVLKVHYKGYDNDPSMVSILLRRGFGDSMRGWGVSVVWMIWIAALCAGAFIPSSNMPLLVAYLTIVVTSCAFIPDNGETVVPYYTTLTLIPLIVVKSIMAGGINTLMPILYVFVLVPLVETLVGVELTNQKVDIQKQLHHEFRFKLLTLLVLPAVLVMIGFGCWWANNVPHTVFEFVGVCICVGLFTGAIGITVGHELCHKASAFERWSGRLLLCSVTYGHFYVEHTLGHHKLVCTDADPATARYGENFYSFLPRVVIGEFLSSIHIETDRIKRKNLPLYYHEVLTSFLLSAAIAICYAHVFGWFSYYLFLGQSCMAILLFESVNFLEHYGLERRLLDPKTGRYEPVQPQHSWDSPAKLTNMILIKLQRHADHHAHAGKRFQTLQLYEESPQLPSGYATMILLAFFPPVWRAVMHPRLMEFRKTQKGQIWRHGPTPKCE